MTDLIRLDKLLSLSGERSRREAAECLRAGRVTVDGAVARDPSAKVSASASVLLDGAPVNGEKYQYYVLHKPAGVLTAARDSRAETVMDLVPQALRRRDVLPVGRLDKDTTGLLLLTNDGELAHFLLSPKRHVEKRYRVRCAGKLEPAHAEVFASGMPLGDFTALPARLEILSAGEEESEAYCFLREGKFHQVKRMFSAIGHEVLSLHRDRFGPLTLDIPEGAFRELTAEELSALREAAKKP